MEPKRPKARPPPPNEITNGATESGTSSKGNGRVHLAPLPSINAGSGVQTGSASNSVRKSRILRRHLKFHLKLLWRADRDNLKNAKVLVLVDYLIFRNSKFSNRSNQKFLSLKPTNQTLLLWRLAFEDLLRTNQRSRYRLYRHDQHQLL